ncbi:hypothetical protein FNH22_11410 [Fulvivirga sp. M361]|uniref:hypothetical protein n=1 Tax=Fulvivirga sp. M361 TaxID=2594266 RepID=UPI00117B6369|nr:hypothetical protein [Fulvivirga sp. M361]TRX59124.1 hypothetical protein FNH22_11410 [Fulvivirga sp. M361]
MSRRIKISYCIKSRLALLAMIWISGLACAQQISIDPLPADINAWVQEKSNNGQLMPFAQAFDDSIAQKNNVDSLDVIPTVFSEKTLNKHFDSLQRCGLINQSSVAKKVMNRRDYAQQVREAFADQLAGAQAYHDQHTQVPSQTGLPGKEDFASSGTSVDPLPVDLDLADFTLPDIAVSDLPPLRGAVLDSAQLNGLLNEDVVNKTKTIHKLRETEPSNELKKVIIPRKPDFFDRWYLEGVVGITDFIDNAGAAHISPALAYRLYGPFSLGVGPDLQFTGRQKEENIKSSLGYRAFLKADLFENSAYLHVENIFNIQLMQDNDNDRRHRFYAGGGYIMRLSHNWGLNFSLLYRVNNRHGPQEGYPSPWLLRLGFSTLKKSRK